MVSESCNSRPQADFFNRIEALAASRDALKLRDLLETVSQTLGNTPAIARKSYIHPAVLEIASDKAALADLRSTLCLPRKTRWLSRYERGLIGFLAHVPPLTSAACKTG